MRKFNWACLLLLMFASPRIQAEENVRVHILSKYHPRAVRVYTKSGLSSAIIDDKSSFPIVIGGGEHAVEVPDHSVKRSYKGRLLIDWRGKELFIINQLPLEEYVAAVTLSELGWTGEAAMQAQAVLARTWALKHLRSGQDHDFDDLTNSQVYKGLFPQTEATLSILQPTRGQVLEYDGELIDVVYYAGCADRGYSAYEIWGQEKVPYLGAVNFPLEMREDETRRWSRVLKAKEIDRILDVRSSQQAPAGYERRENRGRLGVATTSEQWFAIDDFRLRINRALGWDTIPSNYFSIRRYGDNLVLKGRGHGHLVGLCQKQAAALANDHWPYEDILQLFYAGARLRKQY